jgi:hypothetical protein
LHEENGTRENGMTTSVCVYKSNNTHYKHTAV